MAEIPKLENTAGRRSMPDGDKPSESCGVVGILGNDDSSVTPNIYFSLRALQHRGQESAGIAVQQGKRINCVKDLGLVSEVFDSKSLKKLKGKAGIGHVNYTKKITSRDYAQPHVVSTSVGEIALCHNSAILNMGDLKRDLRIKGHVFLKGSEGEVMAYMIADEMERSHDILKAIKTMMRKLVGPYCTTIVHDGRVFGIRDPYGVRPLCIGELTDGLAIVSESVGLDVLDAKFLRDVVPGEVVELTEKGLESHQMMNRKNKALCFFEYIYIARTDSKIDERFVYEVRQRSGARCGKENPVKAELVIPVPDSGRSHAYGLAGETKIPLVEGLIKNRYVYRTFIMPEQSTRDISVREKINPIVNIIKGKKVVLVDDSIVRGTTMRRIVQAVRSAGAKEVHVRIGSPPLIAPCYLGVDLKTRDQLIAPGKTVEEIGESLTADSVGYISIDGVVDAIDKPKTDLCMGCVTGKYPVNVPFESHRFQRSLDHYEEENEG
jgi:amidophosphoribosyltransferase